MTAQTTLSPLPESATTDHTHPIPQPDTKPGRTRRRRNDHGFSMLELLVGMVILGILGAIGYGIYTNFIGDARDTALDQNIQTAAAEIQSVLALEPTFATNDVDTGVLGDDLNHSDDEPDQLRVGHRLGVRRDGQRTRHHPDTSSLATTSGAGDVSETDWSACARRCRLAGGRSRRLSGSISPTPKANGGAPC